jgi:small conductance mechanosensitive channel
LVFTFLDWNKSMDTNTIANWLSVAQPIVLGFGFKVLGAIVVFIVGRWLIGLACRLIGAAMTRQELDSTVQRYLVSFIGVALNIALVVALLGYFGVETTSFAALIAGAGVAIGAAWSGLLSNFAAGIFLLVLRPFKVGDYVGAGSIEGEVLEIGLFGTSINTPDNVKTLVGNAKVMGSDIKNFSTNPYRRVDLFAQMSGAADIQKAVTLLKENLAQVKNLAPNTAIDVEILEFNEFGPKLAVRPYCHTQNYWQVYFDSNKTISETLGAAGFPTAARPLRMVQA